MPNQRLRFPQVASINGVDAGGTNTVQIESGWAEMPQSAPDGLQLQIVDRACRFCRGSYQGQDFTQAISLLTGTAADLVFYERKSGVAEATGFVKHTLKNPIIKSLSLNFNKGGYATVSFTFECKFPAADSTLADVHVKLDSQAKPTYNTADRGGWRFVSASHGSQSIYHLMSMGFSLTIPVEMACNDSDVGYTVVDQVLERMSASGSISFEDTGSAAAEFLADTLVEADRATLTVTLQMAEGATNKVITINGVIFTGSSYGSNTGGGFSGNNLSFMVSDSSTTPLTLSGTDKIITIADVVA